MTRRLFASLPLLMFMLLGMLITNANAGTMNPCSANPCAAKMNPCAAKMNPCAAKAIQRPENYKPFKARSNFYLKKAGKVLFNDTKLSSNGMACATCHDGGSMFKDTFLQKYPHQVQMAGERFGIQSIHLDEMVQLCMVAPMATKPLPWASKDLAALVVYVKKLQHDFIKEADSE
ncbi:MAG: cytochrome c peroxidase [Mariprofundales bacterium]